MRRTMVEAGLFALGLAFALPAAFAQTHIDHSKIAYFVPEKRVNLEARVTDPNGVKVARAYFKAGAQADYTYVPMQAVGGNRYVATLPAPSASTPSIEYLFLAQNNAGTVSRTDAYTVSARRTNETPAWQSSPSQGNVKVFTELTNAPKTVAGFSDSISLDVAESGARLGAAAGLYGGAGGGAAGSTAASSSSTAGTTAASATAGGLSTAAIIGGVVVAGAAAAAAGGGGGGGGGGSSSPGASFAGSWSGTVTSTGSSSCSNGGFTSTVNCTLNQPFTGSVDSAGNFNYTTSTATQNCTVSGGSPFSNAVAGSSASFSVPSNGVVTLPANSTSGSGFTTNCPASSITFSSSPRRISGSYTCTTTGNGGIPGASCTGNSTVTWSGS